MPKAPTPYRPRTAAQPARPSATKRGYDWAWTKMARQAKRSRDAALCDHCLTEGVAVPADETDHVIPFKGPEDPLRSDKANLRGLCRRHHALKTEHQDKRIRAEFDALRHYGHSYEAARDQVIEKWRRQQP